MNYYIWKICTCISLWILVFQVGFYQCNETLCIRGLSKKYPTFISPVRNRDDSAASLCTVKEDTFMRICEFFYHHPACQLLPVGRWMTRYTMCPSHYWLSQDDWTCWAKYHIRCGHLHIRSMYKRIIWYDTPPLSEPLHQCTYRLINPNRHGGWNQSPLVFLSCTKKY